MKWATNKSAVPHSSSSSSFSRIFPVSWFFKSKKKGGNSEKQFEFAVPKSSGWKEGRFYSMDEDDYFWRLSFGDERIPGRKSTGGIKDHEFKISGFESKIRRSEECKNFNEMVSDIKKMKESRGKHGIKTGERKSGRNQRDLIDQTSRKSWGFGDEEEKISNLPDLNDPTSRKSRGFVGKEEKVSSLQERASNSAQKRRNLINQNSRKSWGLVDNEEKIPSLPRKLRGFDDEQEKASTLQERFSNSVSDWLEIEGRKLKEIKIKSDSKKNSAKTNRGVIKSYSPRTECKIRALEEMKKSRSKTKKEKKKKDQILEENTIFDSFAVVKSSYNPQKDFRESMVEMIRERGIEKAEDLEELLACYLTLNCDEYHDLIIKVFRQVWFELKGEFVDHSIKNGSYFDHGID